MHKKKVKIMYVHNFNYFLFNYDQYSIKKEFKKSFYYRNRTLISKKKYKKSFVKYILRFRLESRKPNKAKIKPTKHGFIFMDMYGKAITSFLANQKHEDGLIRRH